MVEDSAVETGIDMVPQREMGYQQHLKKYIVLDQRPNKEVAAISSQELCRRHDTWGRDYTPKQELGK